VILGEPEPKPKPLVTNQRPMLVKREGWCFIMVVVRKGETHVKMEKAILDRSLETLVGENVIVINIGLS
jgi:hypothetical protein